MFRPRLSDDPMPREEIAAAQFGWSLSRNQSLAHQIRVLFVGGLVDEGAIGDVVRAAHAIRYGVDILRTADEPDGDMFRVLRQLSLSSSSTSDSFHGNYAAEKLRTIVQRVDFVIADGCDVCDRVQADVPEIADDLWCYQRHGLSGGSKVCHQSIEGIAELGSLFGMP